MPESQREQRLAEIAQERAKLRDRFAVALTVARSRYFVPDEIEDEVLRWAGEMVTAHRHADHVSSEDCFVCRNEIDRMVDAVMGILDDYWLLDRAEVARKLDFAGAAERRKQPGKPDDMEKLRARLEATLPLNPDVDDVRAYMKSIGWKLIGRSADRAGSSTAVAEFWERPGGGAGNASLLPLYPDVPGFETHMNILIADLARAQGIDTTAVRVGIERARGARQDNDGDHRPTSRPPVDSDPNPEEGSQ